MVRLICLVFFSIISISSANAELTKQEINYFNFFDFNKDEKISFDEITSTLNLIFKLIDENQDGKISKKEIIKLKNLIDSLS
jgi:Ca2+-binding EF-hand superfamily protein|tara:strand:- start:1033 stop:1278 length:246 start_codon:yes stop_codon:yes gene_type:complete